MTAGSNKGRVLAVEACSEIRDWWDYDKNTGLDLENLTAGSKKKVFLKCPQCGKTMHREMYRFLIKKTDGTYYMAPCQNCNPTVPKNVKTLADVVPDIEKYWDYEKNGGKGPDEFSRTSSEKVWTLCPVCGDPVLRNVRFTWEPDENGTGHVITCRTCGKRSKENSLVALFPDITKYWVYEKNKHDPEYYAISSGKKVYLRCPECGNNREIAICDALVKKQDGSYRLSACPACANTYRYIKKINPEKLRENQRSIADLCPDVEKYWDPGNTLRPEDLTMYSLKEILTRCPSCGELLNRSAQKSFVRAGDSWAVSRCQKCAASETNAARAMERSGPAVDECPELKEWWDTEKNSADIRTVTRGSNTPYALKCPACGCLFQRDMHSFLSERKNGRILPVACPECGYSSEGDPDDNLVAVCPEITEWWDYEKNAPYKPEQFTKGANYHAYLKCPDCGIELKTGIHSLLGTMDDGTVFIRHSGRCRKLKAQASDKNLIANYPETAEWWDYEKNTDVPEDYTLFSQAYKHFKCPDCGAETFRRITDAFALTDDGSPRLFKCPYCNNRKVLPGYNSLKAHPELMAEWSGNNEIDPDGVFPTSWQDALWVCPECKGEYMESIRNHASGEGRGCPYCNNRKVLPGFNSLAVKQVELIKNEWSYLENTLLRIDPDNIMESCKEQTWWICPDCGKKYAMKVSDRLLKLKRHQKACVFCNGRRWKKTWNI